MSAASQPPRSTLRLSPQRRQAADAPAPTQQQARRPSTRPRADARPNQPAPVRGATARSHVWQAPPVSPPSPRMPAVSCRAMAEVAAPAPSAPEGVRLNKRMADLGLCSRREADDWIAHGWVQVDGSVASVGQRVAMDAHITIHKAAQGQQARLVTVLLHKPVGYVSGQPEDGYPSAASLIQPNTHWRQDASGARALPRFLRGLAAAGRLDIDSTGLLVLTQDGRVARTLIGEGSTVDKEYLVRVQYQPDAHSAPVVQNVQAVFPPERLALLRHGLQLDGKPLRPAQVNWQNPEQLRFVLTEGKKRQIRRMCEAVGLTVTALKRVRMGRVTLSDLPLGQWRYLRDDERFI